jgi:hypothetical protein
MTGRLSEKSKTVLKGIADGKTYNQIVESSHGITFHDIFAAAKEALEVAGVGQTTTDRLTDIRGRYPNAYKAWSEKDDELLKSLVHSRVSVDEIADRFERQPSAIRSRINKLFGDNQDFSLVDDSG